MGYRGGIRAAIAVPAGLGGVVPVVSAIDAGEEGVALRDCLLDLDLVVGVVFHAHVAREECGGPGGAEDSVGCYECRNEVEALVEVGI